MIHFESTSDDRPGGCEVCVIYDGRDGRIVHVHEFIGDGEGVYAPEARKDRARVALDTATEIHGELAHPCVLHLPADVRFQADVGYRVEGERLVPSPGLSLGDLIARARK